jgi:uncharacterized lipoprotein YmbA
MSRPLAHLLSIGLVVAAAAGCGTSAPTRYYNLTSTATADGAPPVRFGVMVGPVSIPASVDRPNFLVQTAPNRVEVDEFNRWVSPLSDGIARAVTGDLGTLLGTPDVATAPFASFDPVYRVTIDVQRFDSVQGEAALLEAVWTVRKVAGGLTRSGRTVAREALQGAGYEELAAAYSRALAKLSADIAAAIRTAADAT